MRAADVTLAFGLHWQSPQMLGVALLVSVLVVLAVGLLYPSQVKLLPPGWRLALPALRCAALLALAASVARPVADREMKEEEQGAVVVLVDRSASMSVRDTFRDPPMLVALADGLGQLPPNARTRGEVFATLEPYIKRLPTLFDEVRQAQASGACLRECPVLWRLPDGTLLEGTVDVVYEQGNGLTILDFKTDREPSELKDQYERQLRLYCQAFAALRRKPVRGVLVRI